MFDIKIHGKSVRQHTHNGNLYIEGREGTEYTIGLKNNHSTRKLFVVSVDGVNIISGKSTADDPLNGYVVNGYDSLDLKGFRVNDNDVASFKFVKSSQSYAKGVTGSEENNGVIGVKVYDERFATTYQSGTNAPWSGWNNQPDWNNFYSTSCTKPHPDSTGNILCGSLGDNIATAGTSNTSNYFSSSVTGARCASFNSVQETPRDFNLGTGWGSKQTQSVVSVSFDVGSLLCTSLIYYASRQQLEEMGIDFGPKARITMPSAFGEKKYCPIPVNWKG